MRDSAAKAWLRALERTAAIVRQPHRTLPSAIAELASQSPDQPALLSDGESYTYGELAAQIRRYARWAVDRRLAAGETVALLMPNRPEYLAIWLGITSVGGVVALLNTNLTGASLAHSIRLADPKEIIADPNLVPAIESALPLVPGAPAVWIHRPAAIEEYSGEPLGESERRMPTVKDQALYIYTSGTTGLPKAARISHGRVMQWANWFAGMLDIRAEDRMYDCLPMYHSVGGVQAPGALLCGGGSLVIREKFSASRFWADVVRSDCTLFQYIGELCRYLLYAGHSDDEARHRIRAACGNGLGADIWKAFQARFGIPRILEFYAATEGNVSLFNAEGEPGSIGRVPNYLTHRSPVALVRFDRDRETAVRDENGCCVPCEPGETGEAIGIIGGAEADFGMRFEGYTDREASERKILRDVFRRGDAWFRTGDLMRRDARGYFFFVDRIGDTFRWKGENVAASEVAAALCGFPGIRQAIVYGVEIPGSDGRAGMAAIAASTQIDLATLHAYLAERLPEYARPIFLRSSPELAVTSTFKFIKQDFVRQSYDPSSTTDPIYFSAVPEGYVRVDEGLYRQIRKEGLRRGMTAVPEGVLAQ